jgi:periplasmic protein TonB
MLLAAGHSWQQEGGIARWGGALATILALHAGAGLSGFIVWNHTEPPTPPPAAIMLELMPAPAAPPAPQVTAPPEPTPPPEPEIDLTQLLPPIPELPLTPPDIPTPEVVLPKPEPEKKKVEAPKPEKPKEKPKKEKVEKPKPKPKPDSEPEVVQKPTQQTVQQQAAKAAAPVQPSVTPAAPAAADVARVANAKATWEGLLQAHLQKFQKYPRSAQRRNVEGTAWIRFRMDREGNVLSYSIDRTSEHEVLDEAALSMLERAQPLPALPDDVPGSSIEITVPTNFNIPDR